MTEKLTVSVHLLRCVCWAVRELWRKQHKNLKKGCLIKGHSNDNNNLRWKKATTWPMTINEPIVSPWVFEPPLPFSYLYSIQSKWTFSHTHKTTFWWLLMRVLLTSQTGIPVISKGDSYKASTCMYLSLPKHLTKFYEPTAYKWQFTVYHKVLMNELKNLLFLTLHTLYRNMVSIWVSLEAISGWLGPYLCPQWSTPRKCPISTSQSVDFSSGIKCAMTPLSTVCRSMTLNDGNG